MAVGAQGQSGTQREPFLRALWQKYGLIVVGNVVFFALLYFVQYRPNSRENRATELLSMAQREESEQHLEAAETLYAKIVADYGDAAAFSIARERLPKVQALAKKKREAQPPLPESCAPQIDIKELLEIKPSLYLSELVAGHYPEVQAAERERYFGVLDGYVWLTLNRDKTPLKKLKQSPVFRATELQQRYFSLKAQARMSEDWIYDDFTVKNTGFFPLHNAVIELAVTQAGSTKRESVRVAELAAGDEIFVLEVNIGKGDGEVEVQGRIGADEGQAEWRQRL
ncbi:MAG TPA: hypothetical protein VFZ61_07695 [Polyangiales bacterium]